MTVLLECIIHAITPFYVHRHCGLEHREQLREVIIQCLSSHTAQKPISSYHSLHALHNLLMFPKVNERIVIHLTVLLEGNYWKFQLLGAMIVHMAYFACMHMYINRARQHVLPIATKVVIATLICTYTM